MAVNNEYLTERVRRAGVYFHKLETELRRKGIEEIEVNNGEMVEAAGYVGSVLANGFGTSIDEELHKKCFKGLESLISEYTPRRLAGLCESFSHGNRKFGSCWISEARKACDALVKYTENLEREQKTN